MFKHILLPTDGSKLSVKAVKKAIQLAKSVGAKVTAVNITPQFEWRMTDESFAVPAPAAYRKRYEEEAAKGSKKLLDEVRTEAQAAGVECEGVTVISDVPYAAIIKLATKAKCDLIVMASHGRRGISGILLGSETTKVLTHSTIPVLVVR